jgi:ABC-type glycerol-3-phosphate transport system substrate-binding protein
MKAQDLHDRVRAGTGAYDVIFLVPMWPGDFVGGGYLLELDDYIKKKDPWVDAIEPYKYNTCINIVS